MTQPFKILAADKLAEAGLDFIRSQPDAELVNKPGLSEDELAAIAGDHDGMIVRSGVQVTAKVLARPGRLKGIARAGVGVDNIDLAAATSHGILVMNSAEASTISTAEQAFALMMALARNLGPAYRTMCEGGWDRSKFTGTQLAGKTLGVVGFGRIGQTVASRALAFGMGVVAFDPLINARTMMDGKVTMYADFIDMLPHADILTFHVPLNDRTRGMLNKDTFTTCRPGVLVVNAARGGVVDEADLIAALESGQCGGAALDVYATEPPAADSPLRGHPKILTSPHLGASTKEAQLAVSVSAAESLLAYLRGEGIHGAVNAGGIRVDLDPTQACYVDLAGRMAKLLSPMITQGIGQVTFECAGRQLCAVAETVQRAGMVALLQDQLDTPVNIINVGHIAAERGMRVRVVTHEEEDKANGPQLTITIDGTGEQPEVRRITGRVYHDMRPRVVDINRYSMDMIPEGDMVLIQNADQPGMIGLVGTEFGGAGVNIADMTISRRDTTALMVLKVDAAPPAELLTALARREGILKVAHVQLARG